MKKNQIIGLHRGVVNEYDNELPPSRKPARQQKTEGGGYGYGEYDYLYKNASVCLTELLKIMLYSMN